jgi:hypothetical protein
MKVDGRYIAVTAANDKYYESLLAMLQSIKPMRFEIGVFDLGLSSENKRNISQVCDTKCTFIDPGWCVPIPDVESTPDYKKVFLAKPFIPDFFPGFSKYLWIDSDIWFQDCSALEDYLEAADNSGIAICYEDHPMYIRPRKKRWSAIRERLGLIEKSYKMKRIRNYFGREMARCWGSSPIMNSGIFCIIADSPVWCHWQHMIQKADLAGHGRKRLICDQTCLDLATLINRISPTKMPATHNWCVGLAVPMVAADTGILVDPIYPHNPIKVLHSAGSIKSDFGLLQNRSALSSDRVSLGNQASAVSTTNAESS